ncbi:hypothetical protein KC336_g22986 [Hortaea werneckii]|nr:hypothetical protein KC336_g22986 [Hortaea werneckii]
MAMFSDKQSKIGEEATSEIGAASGDSQVNWITESTGPDRSNAHVAVFDDEYALITWEQIDDPHCDEIAFGCSGEFSGSYFQLVNKSGKKIGKPITSKDTYVAGDLVTLNNGTICWPYVYMNWELSSPVGGYGFSSASEDFTTKKMSFGCMSLV